MSQNDPTSHPAHVSREASQLDSPNRSLHTRASSASHSIFNMRSVSQLPLRPDVTVDPAQVLATIESLPGSPQPAPVTWRSRWQTAFQPRNRAEQSYEGLGSGPSVQQADARAANADSTSSMTSFCLPSRPGTEYTVKKVPRSEEPSNDSSGIGSAVLPIPSWLQGRNVVVPMPDDTPLKFAALGPFDTGASRGTEQPIHTLSDATGEPQGDSKLIGKLHSRVLHALSLRPCLQESKSKRDRKAGSEGVPGRNRLRLACAVLVIVALVLFAAVAIATPIAIARHNGGSVVHVQSGSPSALAMAWVEDQAGQVSDEIDSGIELGHWILPESDGDRDFISEAAVTVVALDGSTSSVTLVCPPSRHNQHC